MKKEKVIVTIMDGKRLKKKRVAHILTLLAIILTCIACLHYLQGEKQRNQEHGCFLLYSEADKIQYAIDSRLLNLQIFEMLIMENGGMIDDFDEMAAVLYERDPAVRCLQLAPNGVITHIYPLAGNESGFGDLFKNPDRRDEAIYARDSGNMTLAGPFELHQGGLGVVARRPIYLTDENGEKQFWGFSIQVMDVEGILNTAQLDSLSAEGYRCQVWKRELNTGEKQVFYGVEDISEKAITAEIVVPGNIWYLSLIPENGWLPGRTILLSGTLSLLIIALVLTIAYYVINAERSKQMLRSQVITDSLTGLYSSLHFFAVLKELLAKKEPFSVFYIDLDHFKSVNDNCGHIIGDKLLIETGRRIAGVLGPEALGFRIGGDEFTVILSGTHKSEDCEKMKEKLEQVLCDAFVVDNQVLDVAASCGYASYPHDADTAERLLQIADRNMYKEKGRK